MRHEPKTGFAILALVAIGSNVGCGDSGDSVPNPPSDPVARQPRRVAAENADFRALVAQLSAARACGELRNRMVPLEGDDGDKIGTIWFESCRVRVEGARVRFSGSARGWRWVSRKAKKAGGDYQLRSNVRFAAKVRLAGTIDVAYAPKEQIVTVWLTPESHDLSFEAIGGIDVDSEGAWSSVVGTAGSIFSDSPDEVAASRVKKEGRAALESKLNSGLTATASLCVGDVDVGFGHREPGQMITKPVMGEKLSNKVRLFPGAMVLDGPHDLDDQSKLIVEVEASGAVEAAVVCASEARRLAERYLGGDVIGIDGVVKQVVRERAELTVEAPSCDEGVVVLRAVDGATGGSGARWELISRGPRYDPIIDCGELGTDDKPDASGKGKDPSSSDGG